MFVRRGLSALIAVSMLLLYSVGAFVVSTVLTVKGQGANTMEGQKQNDFVYNESFENHDDTNRRVRVNIDYNWRFIQKDVTGAEAIGFNDSSWRLLNLPHDWSIEGEYDQTNSTGGACGFLPAGIGWYRKTLSIPAELWDGRQVTLYFDGVFCNSTVYVDGVKVGESYYGWLSFSCDITEQVQGKESVEIAVRVDNSIQPAARWYTGSGIYSHVWLISTESVHVAENGTYVVTPASGVNQAPDGAVKIETVVENDSDVDSTVAVRSSIVNKKNGKVVASVTSDSFSVSAGGSYTVNQETKVTDPLLWTTDDPNLYTLNTEIVSDNTVLDDQMTDFGFRSIYYDEYGFYVNGVKTELKGVANHWAIGALGAAQSDNMIRYAVQLMKDMGVNCIRTAHNARPPVFYEICDELGMMVMDELFEGPTGKAPGDYGTLYYQTRWKTDMEYWVKRDRNHPSVVIWSLGNETGYGDNGMTAHLKQFDTTRPTTGGHIFEGVDIPGANGASERPTFERPVEGKPMIATEAPHTHAVRGVYRTQTWYRGATEAGSNRWPIPNLTDEEIFEYDWGDFQTAQRIWPSSYDNAVSQNSVRKNWELTRDTEWRIGEFRWTGFDYLGEANYVLGGWPYRMFHSGAVDTAYFAKDMYYLYQSMWLDAPMLHILPSWTHPIMEEGTEIPVWVYSNCEEVELFFKAEGTDEFVSLGRLDHGPMSERLEAEMQFEWLVPWQEGTIKAVGYDNAGNAILEESHTTASSPAGIKLENTTGEALPTDPSWVGQVTVSIVDKDGIFYPYGENRTYYYVSGPAYLKALENGSPTDVESHVENNRNAFMGLTKAFVSPTQTDGDVVVTVGAILGEKRQLTSDLVYIDVEQLALRGNPEKDEFEIFYTLDGTTPDRSSTPYTGAFKVELGTTVRAAVFFKGDDTAIFVMEERFAQDEGMFWNTDDRYVAENVATIDNAVLEGDRMKVMEYGYGEIYANFDGAAGSVTYTLNAEKAGAYYVAISYNNGSKTTSGTGLTKRMNIEVNGTFVGNYDFVYNGDWDAFWSYRFVKVNLVEGENTLKIASPSTSGANLKEIIYWHNDDVYTADAANLTGDDEVLTYDSAPEGIGIDVHQGGTVSWKITDRPAGTYVIKMVFSSPNPGTNLTQFYGLINGVQKAVWITDKVSPDYGSSWGFYSAEVELAPGTNTVAMKIPKGGALVSALIIEPVDEAEVRSVAVNSASLDGLKLGVENNTDPAVDSDEYLSDYSTWDMVPTLSGAFYLVCRANGKLLVSDGGTVSLADCETNGNARWITRGEMENYDYLVHVSSELVLAIDSNNELIMDDSANYDIGDRDGNRAYWTLKKVTTDFSFDGNTPKSVTRDKAPFRVTASSPTSDAKVTYAVVSGPATIDANTGLVTLTGETGTVILDATLSDDGVNGGARATWILEVTGSQIARQSGAVYSALNATYTSGFKSGTTDSGVGYVDFNNLAGSIDFTISAPADGVYYLAISYNCANTRYFNLIVNGNDCGKFTCAATGSSWYGSWAYQIAKVTLKEGDNAVSISNTARNAAVISEIVVWEESEWRVPSEIDTYEGGSVLYQNAYHSFNKEHIDFGQSGAVSWDIAIPANGKYVLTVAYSTGAAWTPHLIAYADGVQIKDWAITANGPSYGAAFSFLATEEFTLTEGTHAIMIEAPRGGSFVDSIRLELVSEYKVATDPEAVYSSHGAVYPSTFKSGTTADGVEYVDFNNGYGSIDFTVDASSGGEYYVAVGYNTANTRRFELLVNDVSCGNYICVANGSWYGGWSYQVIKVTLNEGSNKISVGRYGTYAPVVVSDIRITPVNEWMNPSDTDSVTSGTTVVADTNYSFNGEHIDFGQSGSASWKISVPYNGKYRLMVSYSTSNTGMTLNAYADGIKTAQWTTVTTGGYGSATGFLVSNEFPLTAGVHTITYEAPNGGAFGDSVRLELVSICETHTYGEDSICDNCGCACTHSGGNATCVDLAVCETCGQHYEELDSDDHTSDETYYFRIDGTDTHCSKHLCCDAVALNSVECCSGGTATCNIKAVCDYCDIEYGALATDNHVDADGTYTPNGNGTHTFSRECCDTSNLTNEPCNYGDDNVCDTCNYDCTKDIAEKTFNSALEDYLANDGVLSGNYDVAGPTDDLASHIVVKPENNFGIEYAYINLRFDNGILMRHHFVVDADDCSVYVDGVKVTLGQDEGYNTFYYETPHNVGELDKPIKITVNVGGDTVEYEVSVYSYIAVALKDSDDESVKTIVKALYDLNEATK